MQCIIFATVGKSVKSFNSSFAISNALFIFSQLLGKTCKVHRLVATVFIPNPENKPTVNHINGIKTDNRVENLEWATFSENTQHAYATGLMTGYTGRKDHGNNQFGKEWTDLNNKGVSLREIGKMYGVAHHTVKRTIIKYAEEQEV